MELDVEMKALRAIVRALEPLTQTARRRVIGYLNEAISDLSLPVIPDDTP